MTMKVQRIAACLAISLLALGFLAAPQARADLVAHYTFDDAANLGRDASGNGHDATVHGDVKPVAGKKGGAISLAAGRNYLSVPYKPELNTPNFTVAAWVKVAKPTTEWQGIVAARGKDGFIMYATNDGCYGFYLAYVGKDRPHMTGPSGKGTKKQRAIAAGKWTRLVGTFQAKSDKPNELGNYEGLATFYMDGKLIEMKGMEYNPTKSAELTIGSLANGNTGLVGEIDEVAVWNTADAAAAHEGMENVDAAVNMSPEEMQWQASLRVSSRAMQRDYYREAYQFVPDRPDKPNVLLVGDSISEGYTRVVRRLLKDEADVYRIPQNGGHVLRGVENLVDSDNWYLGKKDWAVIHLNFGLHDLVRLKTDENGKTQYDVTGTPRHSHEVYERGLKQIVLAIKDRGATPIVALTTPVPPNSNGRVNGEEVPFNDVARRVAEQMGAMVNDLHSPIVPVHDKVMASPGNVHYNEEGSEMLGKLVADKIREALEARR